MKREPFLPNEIYLIQNTGNNSEDLFYEEANHQYFLMLFNRHVSQIATLEAFRCTSNSFEMILRFHDTMQLPEKYRLRMHQPLANFFIAYTKGMNKTYGRSGSLFREHFKRKRIEPERLSALKRNLESIAVSSANYVDKPQILRSDKFPFRSTRLALLMVLWLCLCSCRQQDPVASKLDSLLPEMEKYQGKDSLHFGYQPFYEEEHGRYLVAGDFVKQGVFSAISASVKDSSLVFYEHRNKSWEIIGTEKMPNFDHFEFDDLDRDGRKEMLAVSFPNMNGNQEYTIYYHSKTNEKVHEACNFFGRYEIETRENLRYIYTGSWYADYVQTLYEWKNERLIPSRSVCLSLKIADMKHDAQWIIYSDNPGLEISDVKQVFKETYRQNQKHEYILNHILDDNFHLR